MDWNNIDLNHSVDLDSNLVDPLTFRDLLLEIDCNLPKVNLYTITEQFREDIRSRVEDAWSVFHAKKENILKKALEQRSEK